MVHSGVMQTTEPSSQTGPDETPPRVTPPTVEPDESSNGHAPLELGSAAYVTAWDEHVHQSAGESSRQKRHHNLRLVREVVETGIFALLMFLAVRLVVQNFRVEGLSMNPTYETGQYVLVNKGLYTRFDLQAISDWIPFWQSDDSAHYLFHGPRRGDVVVFEPPLPISTNGERDFIKRVIGQPGEHVEVRDGHVFVDGRQLEERYLGPVQTTCFGQYCDVQLGADQYFVLGDNRPNSSDSRFWGPVNGDRIIGKAWLIYLPFGDFGPAPNGAPSIGASESP
jgi:signal peptidase I